MVVLVEGFVHVRSGAQGTVALVEVFVRVGSDLDHWAAAEALEVVDHVFERHVAADVLEEQLTAEGAFCLRVGLHGSHARAAEGVTATAGGERMFHNMAADGAASFFTHLLEVTLGDFVVYVGRHLVGVVVWYKAARGAGEEMGRSKDTSDI
jgi:hypothetical protein